MRVPKRKKKKGIVHFNKCRSTDFHHRIDQDRIGVDFHICRSCSRFDHKSYRVSRLQQAQRHSLDKMKNKELLTNGPLYAAFAKNTLTICSILFSVKGGVNVFIGSFSCRN
jgi:hypothetical protein